MGGRVAILLPTYNGVAHVEKLLQSVFEQTYSDIRLVVRDDCSADNTLEVVRSVVDKNGWHDRVTFLNDNLGNIGCERGFFLLAESVEADFYAFCDQDDIWLPGKIERAVSALRDREGPSVYYSSFDYCDTDLKIIRHSSKQEGGLSLAKTLFYTPGLGFTIVFNREARDQFMSVVSDPQEMHDRWILRCASCMGEVVYDNHSSAMHIRHSTAVTADDNRSIDLLRHYLTNELFGEGLLQTARGIRAFGELFHDALNPRDLSMVELFSIQEKNGVFRRLRKVFYLERFRPTLSSELLLRLLFLFGKA